MLILAAAALAASPTEIPPFLRGDITVGYKLDRLQGSLSQHGSVPSEDQDVAKRQDTSHTLTYALTMGVAPGVALSVGLPHTVNRSVTVQEWSRMVYDPATKTGSYLGTEEEEDAVLAQGSGVHGVWIDVMGTPFSEAFPKRRNRVTLLLEGGIRTPSPESNWFTIVEPAESGIGERGAGPGGLALRVGLAASARRGQNESYVTLRYQDELVVEVDIKDDQGTLLYTDCPIDPGATFEATIGNEFIVSENAESGARTAFDLHLSTRWDGWSQVPTGVELPAVLVPEAVPAQKAESLELGGGAGVNLRFMKYLQLNLYGDARYHFPQRLEHPYPVYTGGNTLRVEAGAELGIRLR